MPSKCVQLGDDDSFPEDLTKAVEFFDNDLPNPVMFSIEYDSWVYGEILVPKLEYIRYLYLGV